MSIKKQLAAFYDKQGLTGKHRRKAVQWDMKAIRRNAKAYWGVDRHLYDLGMCFTFDTAPEGNDYWARRCYTWY